MSKEKEEIKKPKPNFFKWMVTRWYFYLLFGFHFYLWYSKGHILIMILFRIGDLLLNMLIIFLLIKLFKYLKKSLTKKKGGKGKKDE